VSVAKNAEVGDRGKKVTRRVRKNIGDVTELTSQDLVALRAIATALGTQAFLKIKGASE
jgi:hypothetical protein